MIKYKRTDKYLTVPSSLGNFSAGSSEGDYEQGVADGKEEQAAIDAAKLTERSITSNGSYSASYGFSKVDVDVDTTEAYNSGVEAGKAAQKATDDASLTEELNVTENSTYNADYGYKKVVVNVPSEASLQEKSVSLEYKRSGAYEVTPDEGYDGMSKLSIDATNFGDGRYDDGRVVQRLEDLSRMQTLDVYKNGTYKYEDGYNQVNVNVASANLQTKSVSMSEDTTTVTPDEGYGGMSSVTVDASAYGATRYTAGKTAQALEDESKLIAEKTIDHNGSFTAAYGYKKVTVNVPEVIDTRYAASVSLPAGLGYRYSADTGFLADNQRIDFCCTVNSVGSSNVYILDTDYSDSGAKVYITPSKALLIYNDIDEEGISQSIDLSSMTFPVKIQATYTMHSNNNIGAVIVTDAAGTIYSTSWNKNLQEDAAGDMLLLFGHFNTSTSSNLYTMNDVSAVFNYLKVYNVDSTTLAATSLAHYLKFNPSTGVMTDLVGSWGNMVGAGEGSATIIYD